MGKSGYDYCLGTSNPHLGKTIIGVLNEAGFNCLGMKKSTPALLRTLRTVQPWLAVIDTALPPGNIEQLASIIENDGLSGALYINTTGIEMELYVQLHWPVEAPVLSAVAEAVCNEFARKKKLQQEIEVLQQKLAERKHIEKAKGLAAEYFNLNEEDAYHFLRKISMQKRTSLVEIARRIIEEPDCLAVLSPPRQNP